MDLRGNRLWKSESDLIRLEKIKTMGFYAVGDEVPFSSASR
jgi:hypothetical protein